jgi:hypothetical protein
MTGPKARAAGSVDDAPASRRALIPLSSVELTEIDTRSFSRRSGGRICGTGGFVSPFEEALGTAP